LVVTSICSPQRLQTRAWRPVSSVLCPMRVGRLQRPGEGKSAVVYELVTRNTMEVGQARRRREGLVARRSAQL
jgi:hypothetical protein